MKLLYPSDTHKNTSFDVNVNASTLPCGSFGKLQQSVGLSRNLLRLPVRCTQTGGRESGPKSAEYSSHRTTMLLIFIQFLLIGLSHHAKQHPLFRMACSCSLRIAQVRQAASKILDQIPDVPVKKTQRTPRRGIELARKRFKQIGG